uniref:TOG domain-containing protein n=1 Tax=Hemiselmis andersenii TaxID=464988 RepID=A0A6U4TJI8_HEMAN
MADLEATENLIRGLMNPSNEERQAAEANFEALCNDPEKLCPMLFTALSTSQDVSVRSMSAVMVRKRVTKELFDKLAPATQEGVKQTLITAVTNEPEASVRHKIADTTGEIAAMVMEEREWPEMLPFLFNSAKSPTSTLRESAMLIFSRLTFVVGDKLLGFLNAIKEMLLATLADPESKDVRLAALNASACLVQALSSMENHISALNDLIPHMVQVLTAALNEKDEETSRTALEEFISIAEEAPKFFRRHMEPLVQMSIQIVTAAQLEDETRFLAVELLVTMAEQAPAMMRKQQLFLNNMVPLALQLMLVVEEIDLAEWNATSGDGDDDDTDMTSLDVGKDCLDRMALSLGGKTVFQLAFRADLVPAFLEHPDWKYRHAALCCISQIAEGCKKQMTENMGAIVDQLIGRFVDPHPRVRWAAINAMGQLETDLGPDLQEQYHAKVLPALVSTMDDVENHRVQSHSAAAIINFTENCSKTIMLPYLEPLLGKLVSLLLGGQRIVQEQAITAIASVADCVEEHFAMYYDRIMPTLKQMLNQCRAKEHRLLRGKTMECVSLIGLAVGKEVFVADARDVMDEFMATQSQTMDPDDPQASYLLQAWGRLAKALGHDFIPYLSVVMPPLLKSADVKPDVQIAEDDDEDNEEEGIATVIVQGEDGESSKKMAIKTSALEEKATACNMLVCYFAELQEGMFPYVEGVAKIMVPLLSFLYSEDVRTAAAALMPELAKSAVMSLRSGLCDSGFVNNLLSFIFEKLIKSIIEEPEPEVQSAMIEALHESLCNGGLGCLGSHEKVGHALQALATVTTEVLDRQQRRTDARKDEDYDDDEEEVQQEEAERDDQLLDEVCSALASVTKTHPEPVADGFQTHIETFGKLVQSDNNNMRRIGVCIIDELMENLQTHCQRYLPQLLPPLVQFCQDPAPEVRQASVYGLGVCAQYGGAPFQQAAADVLPAIFQLVQHPQGRMEANVHATDNAVSALGKVLEYQSPTIADRTGAMGAFLSYLPVEGDVEEGIEVHGRMCTFLERQDPTIMAEPNRWIPHVIKVFAAVIGTPSVDEKVTSRIKELLNGMQQSLPELVNGTVAALAPESQAKLTGLMSA